MEQRIRYTEKYPKELDLTFNTKKEFYDFYNNRIEEVSKLLDFYSKDSKYSWHHWKKSIVKLNKDGKPRKEYYPTHLQSKKVRKRQQIKFREYINNKKILKEIDFKQKIKLDQDILKKAIDILLENKVDLSRLIVKIRN